MSDGRTTSGARALSRPLWSWIPAVSVGLGRSVVVPAPPPEHAAANNIVDDATHVMTTREIRLPAIGYLVGAPGSEGRLAPEDP